MIGAARADGCAVHGSAPYVGRRAWNDRGWILMTSGCGNATGAAVVCRPATAAAAAAQTGGGRKAWRRAAGGAESVNRAVHKTTEAVADGCNRAGLTRALSRSHTQRVLGKAQPYATLDAVVKQVAVKLVQRFCRESNVLKLDKAHWPVLLGAEAETFVTPLLGEDCLELLLGGIDGQVANVERVTRRVLIGGVHGREVLASKVLASAATAAAERRV